MLIDFVTGYLPMDKIPADDWQRLRLLTERVMRFKPESSQQSAVFHSGTGELMDQEGSFLISRDSVVYETPLGTRSAPIRIESPFGSDRMPYGSRAARPGYADLATPCSAKAPPVRWTSGRACYV